MQLGLLGMLLGLPQGALANQGQGQSGGGNDLFAQLLGDGAGHETFRQGAQAASYMPGEVAPGSLLAQEVEGAGTSLDALSDLLNQEISAEDAGQLLEQLETLTQDMGGESDLHQQLKEQLEAIKQEGTPRTVATVLTQLTAVPATPAERAPVIERVLGWLKDALGTGSEVAEAPELPDGDTNLAPATPSALLQSLQAASFRDADPAATEEPEEGTSREYVEIVPLSLTVQSDTPIWVRNLTAESAAPVEAAPARDMALDVEIPPLTQPVGEETAKADTAAELPELELPQLAASAPAKPKAGDVAAAVKSPVEELARGTTEPNSAIPQVSNMQGSALTSEHRAVLTQPTPHSPANHAPAAEQVHVAIQRATKEGIDQLTIQLDPADLGRVEVKMATGADGETRLSFVVEKADTMDALARDARSLERALQDAGVKADAGNMQFNLRQQSSGGAQGDGQQGGRQHGAQDGESHDKHAAAAPATATHHTLTLRDGVDIRA